jgi:hypothetical protein
MRIQFQQENGRRELHMRQLVEEKHPANSLSSEFSKACFPEAIKCGLTNPNKRTGVAAVALMTTPDPPDAHPFALFATFQERKNPLIAQRRFGGDASRKFAMLAPDRQQAGHQAEQPQNPSCFKPVGLLFDDDAHLRRPNTFMGAAGIGVVGMVEGEATLNSIFGAAGKRALPRWKMLNALAGTAGARRRTKIKMPRR